MVDQDKAGFAVAIGALFASFGQDATQATLQGYWLGLSDLTIEQVETAVAKSIRECKFVPRPVELRELIGAHQSDDDTAIAAWSDILRAVRLGPYKHIDFQDKLCNAVVRNLGGWVTFLERFSDAESEKWVRLDFVKCYKSFAKSGVSGELIEPLAGLSEREVVDGQLCLPVPRRIACDAVRSLPPRITESYSFAIPKIERQRGIA